MLKDVICFQRKNKNKDYHAYDTRGKNLSRIRFGSNFFTFNSTRIWNAITSKIDIKVSLVIFKFNLKKYLLHNTLEFTYTKWPRLTQCTTTLYCFCYNFDSLLVLLMAIKSNV